MIKVNLLSPERKSVDTGGGDVSSYSEEERESKIHTGAAIGAGVLTLGIIAFQQTNGNLYFFRQGYPEPNKRAYA